MRKLKQMNSELFDFAANNGIRSSGCYRILIESGGNPAEAMTRMQKVLRKREAAQSIKDFAQKHGCCRVSAIRHLRAGTSPQRGRGFKDKDWMMRPSTHVAWYLAELASDLRSFPDWGCLWDGEQSKKRNSAQQAKRWKQTTREKRDAINARIRASRANDNARARRREYKRKKIEENPILKVQSALRARLYKFIKGRNKSGIRNLLGCSWIEFRRHLEAQFIKGITWENYGTHWHVDHIIPCRAFDHSNPAQLRQCWHFSNLRPLSAKKNLAKGAKIEAPQLSLLLTA